MSVIENQPKKRGRPRKDVNATGAKSVDSQVKSTAKKTTKTAKIAKTGAAKKPAKKRSEQGDLFFSLDIGTRTIVGILGKTIDEKFVVQDVAVVPHPKRAMIDGQIEDIKQVAKIAAMVKEELEERNSINLTKVSIAAAGRALRTQNISVEFDIENKDIITEDMVKSMEIEAIQKAQAMLDESEETNSSFYCVGHSVVKYLLDSYNIIRLEGHKGKKAEVDLIAAFLPGIVVESLYSVMDICGLEIVNLTLEPIAAMNVIIPPEIRLINIALVDIGAGTSDIAISKDGSIVAYSMATIAGDEITEEIIRALLVDFNTAELIKQEMGKDEITYKNILGLSQTISSDELYEKIRPAVKNLAETICEHILEVNRQKPAAVFLIGGGSQVKGLTMQVAEGLGIDETNVAVGGHEFLKNVDASKASVIGPEYVTPIGIAVTATLSQGYDFSTIMLNGEKIRVFNTRNLTLVDLLSIAGYKPQQIVGRSGRGLSYTLNGKRQNIKGGNFIPAEIYINNKSATISSTVTQGDDIRLIPAVDGENASQKISDIVDFSGIKHGSILFGGHEYTIGTSVMVNGEEVDGEYQIRIGDDITVHQVRTLGDLLNNLSINLPNAVFLVDGVKINENYMLSDKDDISFTEKAPDPSAPTLTSQTTPTAQKAPRRQEPEIFYNESKPVNADKSLAQMVADRELEEEIEIADDIEVSLNGHTITLYAKSDNSPHLFLDLFNHIEIDLQNPKGDIILTVNGETAAFGDVLRDGDKAVIKWADE